MSRM